MRSKRPTLLRRAYRRARVLLITGAAGTMLASGCNTNDVRALLAGVDAAASQLNTRNTLNFGDQLINELNRLF